MKLESYRNNKTGCITVHGPGFTLVVETDGHVKAIGNVIIEPPAAPFPGVYEPPSNPDLASPRSKPSRKRGSR